MSTSRSEELLIEVINSPHREILHGGKKISQYVFSSNMQYIATFSKEDQSIVGWNITKEFKLEFDDLISAQELKKIMLITDEVIPVKLIVRLGGVSNYKQIITITPKEIIDIPTKKQLIVNAKFLKGYISSICFLENEDLAVVNEYSLHEYCVYIFSKSMSSGKCQWKYKNHSIALKNCEISPMLKNGRALIIFEMPFAVMQINLNTQKLEMQYILNWNLRGVRLLLDMNPDNSLLAVAGKTNINRSAVYVYSTKSGIMLANWMFEEHILNFRFIGSGKEERLFFYGLSSDIESCSSYILNSRTHTLESINTDTRSKKVEEFFYNPSEDMETCNPKIQDSTIRNTHAYYSLDIDILHDIYPSKHKDYIKKKNQGIIIADFIIKIYENNLSIQRLSQNVSWKNYLHSYKKQYVGNTYFNIEEIKQFMQNILDKCESNQISIQSYSDKQKFHGDPYTWIVKTINRDTVHRTNLNACNDKMSTNKQYFSADTDNKDGYILENKVLENGDLLLICSRDIRIYTVNSENKTILIYLWKFLPLPTLNYFNPTEIDDFMDNESVVKLYGKELFNFLIQSKTLAKKDEKIKKLIEFCYEHNLTAILAPTITSFIWLYDKAPPIWIITIAAFLLEIKFLLFFRALEFFGKYFAIMIGAAQQIFSFLFVLGILVLAFAHSLHLLLRPTSEYSYNQPSFTNDANNPWNLVPTYKFISPNSTIEKLSLTEIPDDNTNLFTMFSTSILAVYFMLTGDSSSVSSWVLKDNWTLAFLLIIFSFFTTIYLLNLFITLLGNAIDERYNEESFLQLRGEILAEIELFWMLSYERRKKNWFPDILYYEVSVHELKHYIKNIEDEEILQNLLPAIKKVAGIKDLTEDSTKNLPQGDPNEVQKEMIKAQIDEALKDPIDKINKLIELFEKKD
ncbi:transient receptor potential cation channel subfamily a member 1-like [Gigaspora margarita]|uniref:Transient receptor potential cation channel subfamily a member 1-like n=1 Tax=Gigaspora margarita TaxID=4874 RepID=A0A8H4EVT8_GIGMA|nr:transient receptor potential cation channel subfamily a member 1-like [Gigaspora margarita]